MIRPATILLLLLASLAGAAQNPATVLVFSRTMTGTACGNAAVIGDGTLIVTARHLVFPQQPRGLHQGDAFVTVFSPHLGDAFEADVVAQDRALDLIILRAPMQGHPACELAAEIDLVAAEKLSLAGFCDAVNAITAGQSITAAPQLSTTTLDVNVITVRRGATQSVTLEQAPSGTSWPGAPMLLPGTNSLAAIYTRTQADGSAGIGAAAGQIRALIPQFPTNVASKPPAPDASQATTLYLQSLAASAKSDHRAALDHLMAYIKLRPASAIACRDAAGQARALNELPESQQLYAKALELDPQLVSARVLYGQLLHERTMPTNALPHLQYAWEHGRGSTAAVIPLCNLLREQSREKDCLPILESAVQKSPLDAHLWTYLGQTRAALTDHPGAAQAYARAADLLPDSDTLRLKSAEQFALAADFKSAETQHRLWITQQPRNPAAHYWLARFLSRDRARRDEAMRSAQDALTMTADHDSALRTEIESLIHLLRGGKTSDKDELRL